MKNIKYYMLLAASLLFASCAKEEVKTAEPSEGELVEITVGVAMDQDTKVSYQDAAPNFKWEQGDQIVVMGFNNEGSRLFAEEFSVKEGSVQPEGSTTATIVGKLRPAEKIKVYYNTGNFNGDIVANDGVVQINYAGQTQNGNESVDHLKPYLFLGTKDFTTTEVLMGGNLKLSLLNSIFRFEIASLDPAVGQNLTNITWENGLSLDLTGVNTSAPIKAYVCFDPNNLNVKANDVIRFLFKGDATMQTVAKASADKKYQPGHRYFLKFAKDASEGVIGGFEPVVASQTEVWVKKAAQATLPADKPNFTLVSAEGSDWARYTSSQDITEIPADFFKDVQITECVLPASVTTIGAAAFSGCPLTKLVINAPYSAGITKDSFNGLTTADAILYLKDLSWFQTAGVVNGTDCFGVTWKSIENDNIVGPGLQGFPSQDNAEQMY